MSEQVNALREATRSSMLTFIERAMYDMIPNYKPFPYLSFIAAKIQEPILGERSARLAFNLPPRHGKSFILIAVAAWYLGRYPEREVLLMTHSQSLANDLAGKLRQSLGSRVFKETFPNFASMEGREQMSDFHKHWRRVQGRRV